MTMGAASAAVAVTMQPRLLRARSTNNPGSGSGVGHGNVVEYAYQGQYQFFTRAHQYGGEEVHEFSFVVDDSAINVMVNDPVNAMKAAVKSWLVNAKGKLTILRGAGCAQNQIDGDSNTMIFHDLCAVAKLDLPEGLIYANPREVNADPAKSWKRINKITFDERLGETADPQISWGPEDTQSATVTKPAQTTGPALNGLRITASTTPSTYRGMATFLWSSSPIELGMQVEGGVWVVNVTGSVKVTFTPAPINVTVDLFHNAETVLQVWKDKYRRTKDSSGNIIEDWVLCEVGSWTDVAN